MLGYYDLVSNNYDSEGRAVLNLYQSSENALERGAHWIYMLVDTVLAYDFNIFYYLSPSLILLEMFPAPTLLTEISMWENSSNIVEWARSIDAQMLNCLYQNPYINAWTRSLHDSIENSLILYMHSEAYFFSSTSSNTHALPFTSSLFESILSQVLMEGFLSPLFEVLDILAFTYVVALFLVFFLSYYNSYSKEENTIDQDFFIASSSVESEEEIASVEDISLALVILIFVFGWYFYINCPFLLNKIPELSVAYYALPFLYYTIIFVPTFLIYDFGIFFLTYLRGAATTSSLIMELLYDYIAFAAFYVRLAVQNVRLLLMLFTYFSLYECIMVYTTFNSSEALWQTANTHWNYSGHNSYYFLLKIPTQIIYWIYELLHTFFVLTAQFVAFFAMVFWLFLFLYTMFISEQQEKYFTEKKEKRKKMLKDLLK